MDKNDHIDLLEKELKNLYIENMSLMDMVKLSKSTNENFYDLVCEYKRRREIGSIKLLVVSAVLYVVLIVSGYGKIVTIPVMLFLLYHVIFTVKSLMEVRKKHKELEQIYGKR